MTTDAQGMSQSQDTSSSPGTTSAPAAAPAASAPAPSHTEERTFRQSEVNQLVGREKARAIEEYRRQQTEQPQYTQQKYGESGQPQQPLNTPAANSSEAEMRRLAAEEAQKHFDRVNQDARAQHEAEIAKETVQTFWNKISTGKEKYQDFEAVTSDIEFARFPNVVQLLAKHVDNADDMLYLMGADRGKMATLESLAERSPGDAIKQAQRMSQSLKDNAAASKIKTPNAPLSQMRPSNTGTDNGVMGVKDYRAKWKV